MKLNNKTIRNYLVYSSGIFLLTIPVFYFVLRSVLLDAVDKSLRSQFHEIREKVGDIHSEDELSAWSRLDKDIRLLPADQDAPDEIYTIDRYNKRHHESEPYREMAGGITVDGKKYKLIISSSLIENEDLLGSILILQITVLLVLIGGMMWINQKMSRRLWQPFYVALRNMQQFELNKQVDRPFQQSSTDEFDQLNKAIAHLFSRSYQVFLQQKEFTENAAHEMQTPLAIFQSKLELLMQTSPLHQEQAQLINALDTTNRRLIKLNKSLLLLTKIENHQYKTTDQVNILSLCEKLIDQMGILAESREITIRTDYNANFMVDVNGVLIDILIGNLLSNAIRHNVDKGEIVIATEKNALTISNTGGDTPLQPDKIFHRFHKQARLPGNEDSTGLGLAIVKNICTLYHYTIDYSFGNGFHSFRIGFDGRSAAIPPSYRIQA
ncbi:sensor histidine kinase [Puia dinghuensis]|uniref:histidine kinase n=1 Tax=Puia dinghuensis TaxID=1792502 RepID=A0A8J2UCM5_9BACT|nr:HAMP domain-containing sensor histidine kinase [Puia dinghuensis]GGA97945.1 two-component sensor histidine kinase [Puia dinghuensis]